MGNLIDTSYDRVTPAMLHKSYQLHPKIIGEATSRLVNGLNGCDKVLDIGVGSGMIAMSMLEQGKTVYGLDIRDDMLRYSADMARSKGFITFFPIRGDARQIPLGEGDVDGVYIPNNLTHFSGFLDDLFEGVSRILSSGGRLAITGYDRNRGAHHQRMIEEESAATFATCTVEFTPDELELACAEHKRLDFTQIKDSPDRTRTALLKKFRILEEHPYLEDTCYFILAQKN